MTPIAARSALPRSFVLDTVDTGKTTPITGHGLPLAPGKHKITFVIGDAGYSYSVVITAGQTETMTKNLK